VTRKLNKLHLPFEVRKGIDIGLKNLITFSDYLIAEILCLSCIFSYQCYLRKMFSQ